MASALATFIFICVSTPIGRVMTLFFGVYWIFSLLIQIFTR